MIENIDENMGRLISKLSAWNQLDNTLVIFMSDNGMTGGGSGRGVVGKGADGEELRAFNAQMKGQKGSPDEGGVRVPFFVRWDGKLKPKRDIDRIAAHIDVLPTFAALAGAEVPGGQVEGRSLLPLLDNPQAKWEDRYLYTHQGRWKVGEEPNDYQWQNFAIRNQQFRLVNNTHLYNMDVDPGQTTNIIEQHTDVVTAMRKAYDIWWQGTRPLMVNEGVPMSPTRPYHVLVNKQRQGPGIHQWQAPNL